MKSKLAILLAAVATIGSAGATTITASGGTSGAQFVTSLGTFLTPTNATVEVGSLELNIFTAFATTDATPISFGTVAALLGRWTGNAGDNGATATPFNGKQVWFKITTTADGGGVAFLGSTINFPTNGGGVGDAVSVPGSSLTTFNDTLSTTGTAAFAAAGGFPNGKVTIGVVPEPSAALLGAIGVLGLLRRRRI